MPRSVTLILVDGAGAPLGALPAFDVSAPHWPEVAEVVATTRERFGVEVAVLRMLHVDRSGSAKDAVTYLAEVDSGVTARCLPLAPVEIDQTPHPLRAAYAQPGGPAASLAWAAHALGRAGRGPVLAAVQQRTWNLSAIWRLETATGTVWLKQVPHFFAHEPAVLAWAGAGTPALVPGLLAADGGRTLLDHIAGDDLYHAAVEVRDAIAGDLHAIQVRAVHDLPALAGAGVPDRRGRLLVDQIRQVVAEYGADLPALGDLVSTLDDRLAEVAACGVPDTLVHGDLHPGNVRSDGTRRVIIDWGDSFLGHPAFDILRLTERLAPDDAGALVTAWARRWRASVPGCDPQAAVDLLRPVAALRLAAVYAHFLANIEPAEHPYHADDVPFWLRQAAESVIDIPDQHRPPGSPRVVDTGPR